MSGEFKHLPVDRPRGSHTGFGATGVNQIPEGGLSPTDVVARALAILAAETGQESSKLIPVGLFPSVLARVQAGVPVAETPEQIEQADLLGDAS